MARGIDDAQGAQRAIGRHVDAPRARGAVEQPLVARGHGVPEALAMAVAQVGKAQRLPRETAEALLLPDVAGERAAGGFRPAVVVQVGTWEVTGSDLASQGALGRIG